MNRKTIISESKKQLRKVQESAYRKGAEQALSIAVNMFNIDGHVPDMVLEIMFKKPKSNP